MLTSGLAKLHQEAVMAEDNGSNILWFVAGLGIGAAVGILYAPKTGDETRERIRQAA